MAELSGGTQSRSIHEHETKSAPAADRAYRAIACFVLLSFALAWSLWVPLAWQGRTIGPGDGWPSHLPGLLAPALSAIIVSFAMDGRAGLMTIMSKMAWPRPIAEAKGRVALLVALTLFCSAVPLFDPPATAGDDPLAYSGAPAMGMFVIVYVFVLNGLGEELGWRGFLTDNLLPRLGPVKTSLAVWIVWAVWHAPLFFVVASFKELGVLGALGWLIGIGCGTLVLTWLYIASGRSVLATALWHVSYNFATATAAATALSAGVASALVFAVCIGLLLHPRLWPASSPSPTADEGELSKHVS
ncbi:MAG: CPBP family intramembrane glutamic endopeptidase [Erythrobacter sp.]